MSHTIKNKCPLFFIIKAIPGTEKAAWNKADDKILVGVGGGSGGARTRQNHAC